MNTSDTDPKIEPRYQRIRDNRKDDFRTKAQHDRDRLINSMSLRRLAHVTQVVNPYEGRFYHNRLTHTLQVAMIARRLAQYLIQGEDLDDKSRRNKKLREDLIKSMGDIDLDVVESAALAHDFGHPPFGHIGERTLNRCVLTNGNNDGYEGNAQSFRIVNHLETWSDNKPGMDLTRATLHATLKYPYDRRSAAYACGINPDEKGDIEDNSLKWGVYKTEKAEFEFAEVLRCRDDADEHGLPWRGLEAAIMDWADDIAYATHDIEDFYLAGRIPLDRFYHEAQLDKKYPEYKVMPSEIDLFIEDVTKARTNLDAPIARKLFVKLIDRFEYKSNMGRREQQQVIRKWAGTLVDECVKNTYLNTQALQAPCEEWIGVRGQLKDSIKIVKDLTRYYVTSNFPGLVTQQYGEQRIIEELFDFYFQQSGNGYHEQSLLTQEQHKAIEDLASIPGFDDAYARSRIVADTISSMTDNEAVIMHNRLSGINLGSFLDNVSTD